MSRDFSRGIPAPFPEISSNYSKFHGRGWGDEGGTPTAGALSALNPLPLPILRRVDRGCDQWFTDSHLDNFFLLIRPN